MTAVLTAGFIALLFSLLVTPFYANWLVKRQYGQFIRQDGPTAHYTKRGTPTMGGVIIILAIIIGWGPFLTRLSPAAKAPAPRP